MKRICLLTASGLIGCLWPAVAARAGPEDIVINEIHYHPAHVCESEEFVELFNRGSSAVDLSGWRFTQGVLFAFPEGVVIWGGEFVVLAADPQALSAAYGVPAASMLQYTGRLSDNGEDLVLVDGSGVEIDRVRFNDRFPWPTSPDGRGPSLECRNPAEDNAVAGNWGPAGVLGPRWRFYSTRGKAGDSRLEISLSGPGEFLIDDVSLREASGGPELVANGGFELAGPASWTLAGNHAGSYRQTGQAYGGQACLHVTATGSGGAGNAVVQTVTGLVLNGPLYELSFWALRMTPGIRLSAAVAGGGPSLSESRDIGAVGAAGSSGFAGGVYTVRGSGQDIWGNADEFRFVYAAIAGDAELEANVAWKQAPDGWSKAGLMIRESIADNAKHAMNILSRDNGVSLQYRTGTGGGSEWLPGPALAGNARIRLRRAGNTFTASVWSGGSFQDTGSVTIAMQATVLAGLCVTAHNDGAMAEATFDGVLINGTGSGLAATTESQEPEVQGIATPLAVNTLYTTNLPPSIPEVHAYQPTGDPQFPYTERLSSRDDILIVAPIESRDPVTAAEVRYQIVAPGAYVRIEDPAYAQNWVPVPMVDDGTAGDGTAGDGVFTARIPRQPHRTLVRYRIAATAGGATTSVPFPDDLIPNFACFVYDGVPDYVCDRQSAHGPTPHIHAAPDLTAVPVYHLICRAEDMTECEYREISFGDKVGRKLLRWQGTFVYDPPNGGERQVFDNARFRLRGGVWRYTWQKRSFKIHFPSGHHFKGQYNDGTQYPEPRRTLDLNSIIDQNWTGVRGISGIYEAFAFWLFRQAGVAASHTTWVHFRTITAARESGQYDGDFKGLFLDIEQPDTGLFNTNGRPRGNLYKIDSGAIGWDIDTVTGEFIDQTGRPGVWDKEETDCDLSERDEDLASFYDTYRGGAQAVDWWRANLDLDRYYSYRCVLDSIKHYDLQAGKNYFYYHNSATRLWEVFPWDCDLILRATCCGDTTYGVDEPFWRPVIAGYPATFGVEYRNRFREYLQLVANRANLDPLIDSWVALIRKLHEADRDRWDYFPLPSPYPFQGKTERDPYQGLYRGIDQRVAEMRQELDSRFGFCWSNASNFCGYDAGKIPEKPAITLPASSPVELDPHDLVFAASGYRDPDGDPPAASIWQATRLLPNSSDQAWTNELAPEWREVRTAGLGTCAIPAEALKLGETYLVRARYQDATGRMSLWSEPVRVLVADGTSRKPTAVLEASRYSGGAPLTVVFDGSGSHDPDNDPLECWWDFGDGQSAGGTTVEHRFERIGLYTVTLAVDDGRGRRDSATTVISVLNCSDEDEFALAEAAGEAGLLALQVEPGKELAFTVEAGIRTNPGAAEGIRGWSFGVAHDPAVLQVSRVAAAPELGDVLGPDPYTSTRSRPGGITQAVILSTTTLTALPSDLAGLVVARIDYRLVAGHDQVGTTLRTVLRFSGAVGTPPVEILVNRGLAGYLPCTLRDLEVRIDVVAQVTPRFLRGDANMDRRRDISDAVGLLRYSFGSMPTLPCLDAADANDDGRINVADAIRLLGHLFGGSGALPEPMAAPGTDRTADALDCVTGL